MTLQESVTLSLLEHDVRLTELLNWIETEKKKIEDFKQQQAHKYNRQEASK